MRRAPRRIAENERAVKQILCEEINKNESVCQRYYFTSYKFLLHLRNVTVARVKQM